jgi:uncharacterized membrane protein
VTSGPVGDQRRSLQPNDGAGRSRSRDPPASVRARAPRHPPMSRGNASCTPLGNPSEPAARPSQEEPKGPRERSSAGGRSVVRESRSRSVAKSVSWRVVATGTTMSLVYWFTGTVELAVAVGGVEVVAKLMIFYAHERIWMKVPWGRVRGTPGGAHLSRERQDGAVAGRSSRDIPLRARDGGGGQRYGVRGKTPTASARGRPTSG